MTTLLAFYVGQDTCSTYQLYAIKSLATYAACARKGCVFFRVVKTMAVVNSKIITNY